MPSLSRLGESYLIATGRLGHDDPLLGRLENVPGLAQLFRKQFLAIPTRKL